MIRTWTRGTFRPGFDVFPVLEAFFFLRYVHVPVARSFYVDGPLRLWPVCLSRFLWGFKRG